MSPACANDVEGAHADSHFFARNPVTFARKNARTIWPSYVTVVVAWCSLARADGSRGAKGDEGAFIGPGGPVGTVVGTFAGATGGGVLGGIAGAWVGAHIGAFFGTLTGITGAIAFTGFECAIGK